MEGTIKNKNKNMKRVPRTVVVQFVGQTDNLYGPIRARKREELSDKMLSGTFARLGEHNN